MIEHEPVKEYVNRLFKNSSPMYDKAMSDTATDVTNMLCGTEGCNGRCSEPCTAMKFLLRSVLWNVSNQTEEFQELHASYKAMLIDHITANYG